MTRVYVSIGSNIDRENNIRAGVEALRQRYAPLLVSPVYETAAVGFEGDAFYNLVVGFDTEESPEALRDAFHAIEREQGRRRGGERYASRTLDIDLLTWDERVTEANGLELPRGEIRRQAFVLKPLADIAPDTRHPVAGLTYSELWSRFEAGDAAMTVVDLGLRDG